MKIALVCTEKLPVPPVAGGAIQLYMDGIMPYLSSKHDITVYSIQYPGLPNEEVRNNVRYVRVPGRTDTIYVNSLKTRLGAYYSSSQPPYDLIHIFNRPRYLLQLSDSLPGVKFSLSLHNEMFHIDKISDEAGLRCIERSEFINTVSRYIANTVTQRFPAAESKMHVVYSGADQFKYDPPWTADGEKKGLEMKLKYGLQGHRVILYVGRLSIKKGVHILARAMKGVMQTYPDTALVIAGSKWYGRNDSDNYTNSLRNIVRDLPGPVIMTGFIPPSDIPPYYCMGDIFVCASQWKEPLARVHYEAMAAGLPIITTNRGGNAEVITGNRINTTDTDSCTNYKCKADNGNGDADNDKYALDSGTGIADKCGIVIDKYSDPGAMAEQIHFLLDHPDLALAMGKAGRRLAEQKYNWKRVADEVFEKIERDQMSNSTISSSIVPTLHVRNCLLYPLCQTADPSVSYTKGYKDADDISPQDSYSDHKDQRNCCSSDTYAENCTSPEDSTLIEAHTGTGDSTNPHSSTISEDCTSPEDYTDPEYHIGNISIIGTGYVGLVTGVCLASMGRNVMCCDQDMTKIEKLQNGVLPIFEPSLQNLADNCLRKRRLSFTSDITEAVHHSDIIFITVNTPTLSDNTCDTGHVFDVARQIGMHMDKYKVIVNKSTVPVGTGRTVKKVISTILEKRGRLIPFDIVSNPEFLREGSAIEDFINPDRIVIGADNSRAADIVKDLYREQIALNTPFVITNTETAEMIKYASNAFLATKISFVNEMANLCEECGINIAMVTRGIGLDSRIGPCFLNPGPGFGGSCFPKDVKALVALSKNFGCGSRILQSVLDVNLQQKERMVKKIENALGKLEGSRITVLGLSFKPGTDDLRESPAVSIISALLDRKAVISVYDPQAMENMKKEHPEMVLKYCRAIYPACSRSDCIVLATEWKEFSDLNFKKMKSMVRKPVFIDLRNVYEPEYVKSFGFYYEGVGRK